MVFPNGAFGFCAMSCLFSLVLQMESSLIAQGEEHPIQCVLQSEKSSPTLFNPDRSDECFEPETKITSKRAGHSHSFRKCGSSEHTLGLQLRRSEPVRPCVIPMEQRGPE